MFVRVWGLGLGGFGADVDLSVVEIKVEVQVEVADEATKGEEVTDEKEGPKD